MPELHADLRGAPLRIARRAREQPIFHEGEPFEALYRVERGCVRLQLDGEDGRREIISFLFPGQLVCAGLEQCWASAYAVTDCSLAVIPRARLADLLGENEAFARTLLASAQALLDEVSHHMARLSHADAMTRLQWFLGWLSERVGERATNVLEPPMSRRDIADFLGLAPETVSRLFRRLEARGELRRASRRRIVWSPPAACSGETSLPAAQRTGSIRWA